MPKQHHGPQPKISDLPPMHQPFWLFPMRQTALTVSALVEQGAYGSPQAIEAPTPDTQAPGDRQRPSSPIGGLTADRAWLEEAASYAIAAGESPKDIAEAERLMTEMWASGGVVPPQCINGACDDPRRCHALERCRWLGMAGQK